MSETVTGESTSSYPFEPLRYKRLNIDEALQRSRDLLERPRNEKLYVVLPVGYPAENCRVPVLRKKSLDEVMIVR